MLRNRLIFAVLLIAAGTFASFYGGNVPYILFYLMLATPIMSFLYTFYVYLRIKVFQKIDSMILTKGEPCGYTFGLANEDFISYQDIKVVFYSETSTIKNTDGHLNYCLLPGENTSLTTELRCNFRGLYEVGARKVEVADVFNLFKLSYPIRERNTVTVLPRRVKLDYLNILPLDEDSKNVLFRVRAGEEEELDIDMRKYVPGDSRRLIHWKSTARRGELISRKYTESMKLEVIICMDLSPTRLRDVLERAEVEDKIIESSLAISDYCLKKNTLCDIYYCTDNIKKTSVRTAADFEEYYNECGVLGFTADSSTEKLIETTFEHEFKTYRYIIITHTLTGALYSAAMNAISKGNNITVVLIRDFLSFEQENIRSFLQKASINVLQIQHDEDFKEVFERKLAGGAG